MIGKKMLATVLLMTVLGISYVAYDAGYFNIPDINQDFISIGKVIEHQDDFENGQTVYIIGDVTKINIVTGGIDVYLDGDTTTPLFYSSLHQSQSIKIGDNVAIIAIWNGIENIEMTSFSILTVVEG